MQHSLLVEREEREDEGHGDTEERERQLELPIEKRKDSDYRNNNVYIVLEVEVAQCAGHENERRMRNSHFRIIKSSGPPSFHYQDVKRDRFENLSPSPRVMLDLIVHSDWKSHRNELNPGRESIRWLAS